MALAQSFGRSGPDILWMLQLKCKYDCIRVLCDVRQWWQNRYDEWVWHIVLVRISGGSGKPLNKRSTATALRPLSSTLNRISARLFAQADQKINTENGMECKKAEYNENTSQVICKTSYLLYKQRRNTFRATVPRSPSRIRCHCSYYWAFSGLSCTVSFRAVSRPLCSECTWK